MNHNSNYAHLFLLFKEEHTNMNYLWEEFMGWLFKHGLLEEVANQTAW